MRVETGRLRLLHGDEGGAAVMRELLNEPDVHRYIGDRRIRRLEQAPDSPRSGRWRVTNDGHGLYAIEWRSDRAWLAAAGLVCRTALPYPCIGALLDERQRLCVGGGAGGAVPCAGPAREG